MKVVHSCMLFILKSNMGWKESIYKGAIEEIRSVEAEITGMHKELTKDMQVINPTRILQFEDGNMDSEALIKNFNDAMTKIKDSDTPIPGDFTTLSNIEVMLYLNKDLMPRQSQRIKELKWQKDACKSKIHSLKNPHSQAMQEFTSTFRSYKTSKAYCSG